MATTYTTLLGLATPTQGELSGTWGTTVNDYITTYLDSAIAGTQTISGTQTAVTLSVANGTTLSQAGAGATGSSQYMVINCTGTPASLLTITAPGASKVYVVLNATAQSVKLVGTGPTAGVTLVTGEKAVCAWNGTDFVKVATSVADGVTSVAMTVPTLLSVSGSPITSTGTLALTYSGTALPVANGGTGLTSGTSGGVLGYTASGTLASSVALTASALVLGGGAAATPTPMASLGTTTTVLHGNAGGAPTFGAVSLTADVSGTLPVANGGTGLTSGTSGGVLAYTATGTLASSAALTQYGVVYGGGAGAPPMATANGTTGQVLTALTGGAPGWAAAFSGATLGANIFTADQTIHTLTVGLGAGAAADNTAVGVSALAANTSGSGNTTVGYHAGKAITTGYGNTGIGVGALAVATTAQGNTGCGAYAGYGLTTGRGNGIFHVTNVNGNPAPVFSVTTEYNRIVVGSTDISNAYVQVAWTVVSDARDKMNFASVPHGLDFVNKLNPVQYQLRISREDATPHGPVRYGFRAQDILALEGDNAVIIDNEDSEKLRYNGESLVPVLVNAIQELNAKFEAYVAAHP